MRLTLAFALTVLLTASTAHAGLIGVGLQEAEGDAAAVSVFGHAEGGLVGASGGGSANGGLAAVGGSGAQGGLAAATLLRGTATAPLAIAGVGHAHGSLGTVALWGSGSGGEVAVSVLGGGSSASVAAVAADGDATAALVAVSGLDGARSGLVAVSGGGPTAAPLAATVSGESRGTVAMSLFGGSEGDLVSASVVGDACPSAADGEPSYRATFDEDRLPPEWLLGSKEEGQSIVWGHDPSAYWGLWMRDGAARVAGSFRVDTVLGLDGHGLEDGVVSFRARYETPPANPIRLVLSTAPGLAQEEAYELEFDMDLLARFQEYRIVVCNGGHSVRLFLGEEAIASASLPGATWVYFRVGDANTWLVLDDVSVTARRAPGQVAVAGMGEAEGSAVAVSALGSASAGPRGIAVAPLARVP